MCVLCLVGNDSSQEEEAAQRENCGKKDGCAAHLK